MWIKDSEYKESVISRKVPWILISFMEFIFFLYFGRFFNIDLFFFLSGMTFILFLEFSYELKNNERWKINGDRS